MTSHLEELLKASVDLVQFRKVIDVQRQQIDKQADEIDLLNARINWLELKLAREAEINSDITTPMPQSMFHRRQAG